MPKAERQSWTRWRIHLAGAATVAVLLLLGNWQLARLAWKRALIARVESRVHAPPQDLPALARWSPELARAEEYRHVRLHGTWLANRDTLVAGTSVLGSGYWQLVPLQLEAGGIVLVNRGFVATRVKGAPDLAALPGPVTVTGLLRVPRTGGSFLRRNQPAADRWYSNDVAAIAAVRGLHAVAPFLVDADAAADRTAPPPDDGERLVRAAPTAVPVGGLTVVDFPNDHLGYALTWFALAAMAALGWWRVQGLGQAGASPAPHGQEGLHGYPATGERIRD
ncbi:MAG: SURF1 family protein [Pseudomonadota bacterium]|nr:SURF1 family protein [Pseudomonadota bacterium]